MTGIIVLVCMSTDSKLQVCVAPSARAWPPFCGLNSSFSGVEQEVYRLKKGTNFHQTNLNRKGYKTIGNGGDNI